MEATVIEEFKPKLISAILAATGFQATTFSDELVSRKFITMEGGGDIVQVDADPPRKKISTLLGIVYEKIKTSKEGEKLFKDFLKLLREIRLEDLPEEMEARYYKKPEVDISKVQCGICLDIWYNPSTLKCGHTFCQKCILEQVTKYQLKCPTCTKTINEKPMLFVDGIITILDDFFQKNQSEEKRIREKNKDKKIEESDFNKRFEMTLDGNQANRNSYFS